MHQRLYVRFHAASTNRRLIELDHDLYSCTLALREETSQSRWFLVHRNRQNRRQSWALSTIANQTSQPPVDQALSFKTHLVSSDAYLSISSSVASDIERSLRWTLRFADNLERSGSNPSGLRRDDHTCSIRYASCADSGYACL